MVEKCALVYRENWKCSLLVTKWHNHLWLSSLYIPDPATCTQPRSVPLTLVILLRCNFTMCFLFLLHYPLTYWIQSVKHFSHVKWFKFDKVHLTTILSMQTFEFSTIFTVSYLPHKQSGPGVWVWVVVIGKVCIYIVCMARVNCM